MTRIQILFLLLFEIVLLISAKNIMRPVFEYILKHDDDCGDPFSDPVWLPALEDCQLDCDISAQLCQENMNRTYPGQRCINLPYECSAGIKEMLDIDQDTPALQLPLAPLTTLLPPTTTTELPVLRMEFSNNVWMPAVRPTMPKIRPAFTQIEDNDPLEPPPLAVAKDVDYSDGDPPSAMPMPPAIADDYTSVPAIGYYTTPTTPASPRPATFAPLAPTMDSLPPMPQEYEDETNVNPESSSRQSTGGGGSFNPEEQVTNNPVFPFFGSTFGNFEYTTRSPYSPPTKFRSPLSWNDLSNRLKKRPFYSIDDSGSIVDYSFRCCEWALDGMCDRSWQRVRQLCPKSCGTVVCASVDGALSCNRAIDVDVLDCFQRRRLAFARGSKIHEEEQHQKTEKKKHEKVFGGYPKPKQRYSSPQEFAVANAFSIENEIRGFANLFAR